MDERHEVPYTEDQTHQSLYETPTPGGEILGRSRPEIGGVPAGASQAKKRRPAKRFVAAALGCAVLGGAMGLGGGFFRRAAFPGKRSDQPVYHVRREAGEHGDPDCFRGHQSRDDAGRGLRGQCKFHGGHFHGDYYKLLGFQTTAAASGSGFILTDNGYVLTNYHVIEDASSITVTMYDGSSYDAALVGYDESNDIAVLKIEAEGLTPVVLGDSDHLNVGDSVVAIETPWESLPFSLTSGAVSALDREITLSNGVTMDLIQTDCAINSGNSGGALFNLYGEVIGITNAKYSGSGSSSEASIDNIGFAIPINHVRGLCRAS